MAKLLESLKKASRSLIGILQNPTANPDEGGVCLLRLHGVSASEGSSQLFQVIGVDAQVQDSIMPVTPLLLDREGLAEHRFLLPGPNRHFNIWIDEPNGERVAPEFGPVHGAFPSVIQVPVYPLPVRRSVHPEPIDVGNLTGGPDGGGGGQALSDLAKGRGWSADERIGVAVLVRNVAIARLQPELNQDVAKWVKNWSTWLMTYGIRAASEVQEDTAKKFLEEFEQERSSKPKPKPKPSVM
jgi:hypothetical protein